jgi:hypothetical protein
VFVFVWQLLSLFVVMGFSNISYFCSKPGLNCEKGKRKGKGEKGYNLKVQPTSGKITYSITYFSYSSSLIANPGSTIFTSSKVGLCRLWAVVSISASRAVVSEFFCCFIRVFLSLIGFQTLSGIKIIYNSNKFSMFPIVSISILFSCMFLKSASLLNQPMTVLRFSFVGLTETQVE